MNNNQIMYAVFAPIIILIIGLLGGIHIGKEHIEQQYQDITPTSTIKVDYDTYQCELQENGDD